MHPDGLKEALGAWRLPVPAREEHLQDAVEQVLRELRVEYRREFYLGEVGTVDFLVAGGIAVEIKIKGQQGAVLRQLYKYATAEAVSGVLLVSTRPAHVRHMPEEMCGKPVRTFLVGYLQQQ